MQSVIPSLAFAVVRVDEQELAQGENAVGGGVATFVDTTLDMVGVVTTQLYTDESLTVNFNGGNEIGSVDAAGSAQVELNFPKENEIDDVYAAGNSSVTINANGNNEFGEVIADSKSNLTINVTGENEFEEIVGYDDANVTIRGTDCQKKDTIVLDDGEEDTQIAIENGSLVIDHATIDVEGEMARIGSLNRNVLIDTSKVAKEGDNEFTDIMVGGTMDVTESVVDIKGTVHAIGKMAINHSNVKVEAPDSKYSVFGDTGPYRVYSKSDVELIREKNGEIKDGEIDGTKVRYVDTDDGDEIDLEADGDPAYYKCGDDDDEEMPKTGDAVNSLQLMAIALVSAALFAFAGRRLREDA